MTNTRTERLLLRRWRDADCAPFAALNADPAVMRHFPGVMSRGASDDFVDRIEAHWNAEGWGLWAVEVPQVVPFIGYVGLWPATHVTGVPMVEVGWRLAQPYWGRGYATDAACEALRDPIAYPELVRHILYRLSRSAWKMQQGRTNA
ncbi:MAG: GNAT family N-acetyltransferase, partial [Chloroflexota bacterium]